MNMARTREDEHSQNADDGNLKLLKKMCGSNRGKVTRWINEPCEVMNEGIIDTDFSTNFKLK